VLALDYGSARCGVAVSDPTGVIATPLESISEPASERGLGEIARVVAERGVEEVLVGLPVSLSGSEGAQAAEARRFAECLAERLDVPVTTFDERYTTSLARRTSGRLPEDSRAAAHLLESYLSARR
jgi:putative Holliday junction resolvase